MVPPSEIQLIIKTRKTTVLVQTPLSATIQSVKSSVLSALNQFDNSGTLEDVPSINSEDDFELCKMDSSRYKTLDASKRVRDQKLMAWATLFVRFRDQSGTLQDVQVTEPSIDDDEDPPTEPNIDDDEDPPSQSQGVEREGKA